MASESQRESHSDSDCCRLSTEHTMKCLWGILACISLSARGDELIAVEEGVLVLTEDNFQAAIESHSQILVEFYAPWCGQCKKLAPEYSSAASQLAEKGAEAKLAKVDATEQKELGQKFGIKGRYKVLVHQLISYVGH